MDCAVLDFLRQYLLSHRIQRSLLQMEIFTLSSVFKVSRILGLFPFDNTAWYSKKWLIYCIFFQFIICLLVINYLIRYYYTFENFRNEAIGTLSLLNSLEIILYTFSNVFTVLHLVRNRVMVFHLFDSINKEIVKCCDFPKIRFFTIYINIFLAMSLIILWKIFFDIGFMLETLHFSLSSFLIYSSTIGNTSQLWDLMRLLTILLQETSKGYDENSIIFLEKITTYGDFIKEIYGPFLFIMVVLLFVEVVCYLYVILLPVFPGMLGINLVLLLYTLSCFFKLGSIVYTCSSFLDEIQWFNDKLHWKILNDKTGRYSNNEMFFFHFIAYKKTKFSACGFFDIDYTLIGTMISVCTTYLVIVLQYGQGSQS
ncbi:Gustatory receptor 104c [Halyomorpha halys]|nr:Gustatory receptor 104c [Halyomorpha halys]